MSPTSTAPPASATGSTPDGRSDGRRQASTAARPATDVALTAHVCERNETCSGAWSIAAPATA